MLDQKQLQLTEVTDERGRFLPHVVEILRLNIIDSSPTLPSEAKIQEMIRQLNRDFIAGSLALLAINGLAHIRTRGKKLAYASRDHEDAKALVNSILDKYGINKK